MKKRLYLCSVEEQVNGGRDNLISISKGIKKKPKKSKKIWKKIKSELAKGSKYTKIIKIKNYGLLEK